MCVCVCGGGGVWRWGKRKRRLYIGCSGSDPSRLLTSQTPSCVCVCVGGGGGLCGGVFVRARLFSHLATREVDYNYLSLHCHHQNDSRIKTGSDGSYFNVSLIVRDKVTRQCHRPQLLNKEESRSKIEPRPFCLPA